MSKNRNLANIISGEGKIDSAELSENIEFSGVPTSITSQVIESQLRNEFGKVVIL